MWLLFLLLVLVMYFIIVPIIKALLMVQRLKNQARDMFNRATGRSTGDSSNHNNSQPQHPRKKIDPGIGEYVEFEEIEVTSQTQNDNGNVSYRTENQITDVEWEDVR